MTTTPISVCTRNATWVTAIMSTMRQKRSYPTANERNMTLLQVKSCAGDGVTVAPAVREIAGMPQRG